MTDVTATILRGMTWDHPRGYEPLAACSAEWERRTGTRIEWHKRSLQDFESYPVETLAREFDLIVIDHPHIGQVTRERCLLPLDAPDRQAALGTLAAGSVGQSLQSYHWDGHQWALPIDAATQVQAWVPGRIDGPVGTLTELMALARQGKVAIPMRAPHSLMTLYTLLAHSGHPGKVDGPIIFKREAACEAYETLRELTGLISASCWTSDPIAVFESMSRSDSPIACAPYIYGYVNYALNGFRPMRIAFADIPVEQGRPPHGSALGGTGIAVSARTRHPDQARDFAYWLASADVQRTLYASSGGQPGHASAWEDDDVNAPVLDFYRATRATLEGAWVRPRHDGYMAFQQAASDRLNQGLRGGEPAGVVIDALNALFASSLHGEKELDSAQEHTGARNARGVVQG